MSVGLAPRDYVDAMLRAIVGIDITVTRLEGKFKLCRNRSAADRQGVLDGRAAEPDAEARRRCGN